MRSKGGKTHSFKKNFIDYFTLFSTVHTENFTFIRKYELEHYYVIPFLNLNLNFGHLFHKENLLANQRYQKTCRFSITSRAIDNQ
jgi:hypothetical protein